jgi:hypothetical protein
MQLTVEDVAGLPGIPGKTGYGWMDEWKLPGYHLSGQHLFDSTTPFEGATRDHINILPRLFEEPASPFSPLPATSPAFELGAAFCRRIVGLRACPPHSITLLNGSRRLSGRADSP